MLPEINLFLSYFFLVLLRRFMRVSEVYLESYQISMIEFFLRTQLGLKTKKLQETSVIDL